MKFNRKRLFVDPAFQGRLLFRLVVYWTIYHVALWHVLFLFAMFSSVMNYDPALPPKGLGTLYHEFSAEHATIILCFLAMLPILLRDMLKFSHRIAGPLIRFQNVMSRMIEGERVEVVSLRRNDLPGQVLGVFNKLVVAWNERSLKGPSQADPSQSASKETELEFVESK